MHRHTTCKYIQYTQRPKQMHPIKLGLKTDENSSSVIDKCQNITFYTCRIFCNTYFGGRSTCFSSKSCLYAVVASSGPSGMCNWVWSLWSRGRSTSPGANGWNSSCVRVSGNGPGCHSKGGSSFCCPWVHRWRLKILHRKNY